MYEHEYQFHLFREDENEIRNLQHQMQIYLQYIQFLLVNYILHVQIFQLMKLNQMKKNIVIC